MITPIRLTAPLAVILPLTAFALNAATASNPKASRPPNIIVILADDLGYGDLSCFGQKNFQTPSIDRLAGEGMVFTQAFSGGAWCAPSRAALLTGRHMGHLAPLEKNEKGEGVRFNPILPQMLQPAGYVSCALGKWHMYEGKDSYSFPKTKADLAGVDARTNWAELPWNRGFDVCRIGLRGGYNNFFPWRVETGDHQALWFPENDAVTAAHCDNIRKCYDADGVFMDPNGKKSSALRYSEDIYRQEAVSFMEKNKEHPFFLYYATTIPHGPLAAPALGKFKDKPAPWTMRHKIWAAMIEELDKSVGVIVDEVKKLGLEKNTVILFASDNGYASSGYLGTDNGSWSDDPVFHDKGRNWKGGKFVNTDGGVAIPMIAWGGPVAHGTTSRAVVFYDFMSTFSQLAGAPLPGPTDGVSFVPLLQGKEDAQPIRPWIGWRGDTSISRPIPDDFAQENKSKQYRPDAVLLDERWFALEFREGQRSVIRLFDISNDLPFAKDLSSEHPELCRRAREAIHALHMEPVEGDPGKFRARLGTHWSPLAHGARAS